MVIPSTGLPACGEGCIVGLTRTWLGAGAGNPQFVLLGRFRRKNALRVYAGISRKSWRAQHRQSDAGRCRPSRSLPSVGRLSANTGQSHIVDGGWLNSQPVTSAMAKPLVFAAAVRRCRARAARRPISGRAANALNVGVVTVRLITRPSRPLSTMMRLPCAKNERPVKVVRLLPCRRR